MRPIIRHSVKGAIAVIAAVSLLAGCGPRGCAKSSPQQPKLQSKPEIKEPGTYLKWVLKLSGGTVTTVELSKVDSSFKLISQPVGNYAAVVWNGEKKIAAYPFYFPSTIHSEGVDEQGNPVSETIPLTGDRTTHLWIKVEGPFDKLTVINPNGETILEATGLGDGTPFSSLRSGSGRWQILRNAYADEQAPAGSVATHVRILGLNASWNQVPPELMARVERVTDPPPDEWVQSVTEQMLEAAPAALSALMFIGLAQYYESDRSCASTVGSIILINARKLGLPGCQGTLIHELAHAYEHLLTFYSESVDPGQAFLRETAGVESPAAQWPSDIRGLAQRTIERLGIRSYQDFLGLWVMIQQQGKRFGVASDYVGDGWTGLNDEAAARGGFARSYGASLPREDLATYVEQIQGVRYSTTQGATVCRWMREASNRIDTRVLIPYVKVLLLQNAGFLTAEKARECHGNFVVRGEKGIHLHKGDLNRPTMSFERNVKAGYQVEKGVNYFSVLGSGEKSYQILVQVLAQDGSGKRISPLGLHRLDNIGPFSIGLKGNNGVYLAHDNVMRTRASFSGLVLISDYSLDPVRVEGAIFFLTLRGATGGPPVPIHPLLAMKMLDDRSAITDSFPLVTFRYEP